MNILEPPLVISTSAGERHWVEIPKNACMHHKGSRGMILEAANAVRPKSAIALGAGRCEEIPLRELLEQFESLTLIDHDESALRLAVQSVSDSPELSSKIEMVTADLTGVEASFFRAVAETLDESKMRDQSNNIETILYLTDTVVPKPFHSENRYDLVIASCVSCQLHVSACNRAIALFEAAFPGGSGELRRSERWIAAIEGLARRMERAFLDSIAGLVAPAGRVFFSDTVQGAFLHVDPEGRWLTDGLYRMTRSARLADDLDSRFQIELPGRWHWIVEPSREPGGVGRFFNVQAFVLSIIESTTP